MTAPSLPVPFVTSALALLDGAPRWDDLLGAPPTALLAVGCVALFAALGLVDTVVYHFRAFALHRRDDARREHRLHTLNVALLAGSFGALLLGRDAASLAVGSALALAALAVELADVFEEARSRAALGGRPVLEDAFHFGLSFLRGAAVAFAVATRLDPGSAARSRTLFAATGVIFVACSLPVGALHVRYLVGRRAAPRAAGVDDLR